MNIEYTPWVTVGTVTVRPNDTQVVVGDLSIDDNYDTIWVRVRQISPSGPWPWSFVIIGWETAFGYELGTVKAYAEREGEVFTLRTGRPPLEFTGRIIIEPRSFNLQWVRNGYPLTLRVDCSSGKSVPIDGGDTFGDGPSAWSWRDATGTVLDWGFKDGQSYVNPIRPPKIRIPRFQ